MFALVLDLSGMPVAIAGRGEAAVKRLALVRAAKPSQLTLFAPDPGDAFARAAGDEAILRLPSDYEISGLRVLFTAGLGGADAERLAGAARAARVLVNTEDVRPLCDFHVPAVVRRGDLLISVSTNGASPALARLLRQRLEQEFDGAWEGRVEEVSNWREGWRREGVGPADITLRTEAEMKKRGWL